MCLCSSLVRSAMSSVFGACVLLFRIDVCVMCLQLTPPVAVLQVSGKKQPRSQAKQDKVKQAEQAKQASKPSKPRTQAKQASQAKQDEAVVLGGVLQCRICRDQCPVSLYVHALRHMALADVVMGGTDTLSEFVSTVSPRVQSCSHPVNIEPR